MLKRYEAHRSEYATRPLQNRIVERLPSPVGELMLDVVVDTDRVDVVHLIEVRLLGQQQIVHCFKAVDRVHRPAPPHNRLRAAVELDPKPSGTTWAVFGTRDQANIRHPFSRRLRSTRENTFKLITGAKRLPCAVHWQKNNNTKN